MRTGTAIGFRASHEHYLKFLVLLEAVGESEAQEFLSLIITVTALPGAAAADDDDDDKKFELMLTRRAKAYSSSSSVV